MQQKKRILLLATGGTIASRKSDNGLKPQITPEELIEYIPQVKEICDVEAVQLLNLDAPTWSRRTGNSWFMRSGSITTILTDS